MRRLPAATGAATRLAAVGAVLAGAALLINRTSNRTGVADGEVDAARLGDDVISNPTTIWNRGITIDAEPARIWPWLVQMGYGRAGFYIPEWVDRLVWRVPAANSHALLPQFQQIQVGDVIADGPGYLAYWRVIAVDPDKSLVYWTCRHPWRGARVDPNDPAALEKREAHLRSSGTYVECTWGFYLTEIAPGRSRLVIRTRAVSSPRWLRRMPYGLVDAYLSHSELTYIKRHAEQSERSISVPARRMATSEAK